MKIRKKIQKGLSLVESLIAIAVISSLVFVFMGTANNVYLNASAKNRSLAYQLAQEEIEALKKIPYASLTDRTDASFIEVAYNYGDWKVINDGASNVYSIAASGSQPSLALLPADIYNNFTLEVKIKVLNNPLTTQEAGFYFRYHDKNNYYLVKFNSSTIKINKKLNGTETTLFTTNLGFLKDTWYNLKLTTSGSTLNLYRDSSLLTTGGITDTSFLNGKIGLYGSNSVQGYFDEVKIDTAYVNNGDFEEANQIIGEVALDWQRSSLYELPSAADKLTITAGDDADIKEVTAKIEWQEKNRTKSVSLTTLITKYGVGK